MKIGHYEIENSSATDPYDYLETDELHLIEDVLSDVVRTTISNQEIRFDFKIKYVTPQDFVTIELLHNKDVLATEKLKLTSLADILHDVCSNFMNINEHDGIKEIKAKLLDSIADKYTLFNQKYNAVGLIYDTVTENYIGTFNGVIVSDNSHNSVNVAKVSNCILSGGKVHFSPNTDKTYNLHFCVDGSTGHYYVCVQAKISMSSINNYIDKSYLIYPELDFAFNAENCAMSTNTVMLDRLNNIKLMNYFDDDEDSGTDYYRYYKSVLENLNHNNISESFDDDMCDDNILL